MEQQRQKKKLLMYVDVNITPVRTGRIGIYEGDDVRGVAKNFQRTFQLNGTMLHMLTLQLEQHLKAYKDKHGLAQDGGSTFPIIVEQQLIPEGSNIHIQDHQHQVIDEQQEDEDQSDQQQDEDED